MGYIWSPSIIATRAGWLWTRFVVRGGKAKVVVVLIVIPRAGKVHRLGMHDLSLRVVGIGWRVRRIEHSVVIVWQDGAGWRRRQAHLNEEQHQTQWSQGRAESIIAVVVETCTAMLPVLLIRGVVMRRRMRGVCTPSWGGIWVMSRGDTLVRGVVPRYSLRVFDPTA
jgi:hypothetical protein